MDRPDARTKAELDAELIQALDDLVADGRLHEERIRQAQARTDSLLREHRPPYGDTPAGINRRLGDIDRTLTRIHAEMTEIRTQMIEMRGEITDMRSEMTDMRGEMADIREQMATKVELEGLKDEIKMVADGYTTVNGRLDKVADLLKVRVVLP